MSSQLALALGQVVGLGVDVDGDDVAAVGCQRGIVQRGDAHLDVGALGGDPLQRQRLRPVHVGQRRGDLHDAALVAGVGIGAGGLGQLGHGQVDLDAGADAAVGLDRGAVVLGHVLLGHQLAEGALGVGVREHHGSGQLLAARQPHAGHPAAGGQHLVDLGVGAHLGAGLAGGVGHVAGDLAHAAVHEAPRAHAVGRLAGVVVQQHVGGAGGGGARHAVVDRVPAHRRLQVV